MVDANRDRRRRRAASDHRQRGADGQARRHARTSRVTRIVPESAGSAQPASPTALGALTERQARPDKPADCRGGACRKSPQFRAGFSHAVPGTKRCLPAGIAKEVQPWRCS